MDGLIYLSIALIAVAILITLPRFFKMYRRWKKRKIKREMRRRMF